MASAPPKLCCSALVLCMLVLFSSLMEGCANIIPPLGGPRDTLPPVLISVVPRDSVKNFTGQKIVFNFDEYVTLDQIQENLLVSPTPKINPIVESHLRTVTVRIKDTLEPNTTYVINFGKAIRDVNENNPLKNFRYIFTTGTYLDSMELPGKVILAENGKTDSTLIVVLHKNLDDSAIVNDRPRYYTHVDKEGKFNFTNLAPGTYAIYALKSEGGGRSYMSPSQLFAFADKPVVLNGSQEPIILYAYAEPAEIKKPKGKTTPTQPATKKKSAEEEKQDKRLKYSLNMQGGQQDILQPLIITFAAPLKEFDSTKFRFTNNKFENITNYQLEKDSTNTIFKLRYNWPLEQEFNIIAEKGMASDSTGKSLTKNDTIHFRTMKDSDYGSLKLRFSNIDTSRKPVLLLVQAEKIMYSYPIKGRELFIKRFRPAEFELQVLYDENGNGHWDHGSFFGTRRQPEKVQAIAKKLNIKANWDNEVDITL
jgi:hypothetical protein